MTTFQASRRPIPQFARRQREQAARHRRAVIAAVPVLLAVTLAAGSVPDPAAVAVAAPDARRGLAAVHMISDPGDLAGVALEAGRPEVRRAAFGKLADPALGGLTAAEDDERLRLVYLLQEGLASVPEHHRSRLAAVILPAVAFLGDRDVVGVVGRMESITARWSATSMEYLEHTLAGEQLVCSVALAKQPRHLSALWSARFPPTVTVRHGQIDQSFVELEAELEDLLAPVFDILPLEVIARAALERRDPRLRRAAAGRLTDPERLADIAVGDRDETVRRAAVKSLANQDVLARVAGSDPARAVRLAAVARLTDQARLAAVIRKDDDSAVRLAAMARLTNPELLAELILDSGVDENLREAAVAKVSDQVLLARVAAEDEEETVRRVAVGRLSDQELLAEIARMDEEETVRLAAVERVTDQDVLTGIALEDECQWVREAAVERLNDSELLARIARQDSNQRVRRTAQERLDQLGALQRE